MEIKTKFNIGDIIFIALSDVLKAKIIKICLDTKLYFVHYFDGGIGYVTEEEIFTTEEEARKEYDRRNK